MNYNQQYQSIAQFTSHFTLYSMLTREMKAELVRQTTTNRTRSQQGREL